MEEKKRKNLNCESKSRKRAAELLGNIWNQRIVKVYKQRVQCYYFFRKMKKFLAISTVTR
jgi:hypothetical protein